VAAVKVLFVLAVLRVLAGPFTEDAFGRELLPMPTWEWTLCSASPVLLIYLARRPEDWKTLAGERTYLRIFLAFYLLWALAFAVFRGEWILCIAVAASLAGFAGMHRLNRKESTYTRRAD
jgi:hypothetical protein